MVSTSKYGIAVKKFTSQGIHPKWLLPIAPVGAVIGKNAIISGAVLGKAPGRFNPRLAVWSGLGGKAVTQGVTKADFEEFAEWPTPNVGVLGRAYPGIDSDANSDDARLFIEGVIWLAFGRDVVYGERLRGSGPRRLYAFKCSNPDNSASWVRTRHITYRLPKDQNESKLDIIGYGGQYLIAGIHPTGDDYLWHREADFAENAKSLTEIDNEDIERFLTTFYDEVKRVKGTIIKSSGNGGVGDEVDITELEPVMPVEAIIDGLKQIPNTPDTFLHRDDLVSALAAVRAALGKESLKIEVETDVLEWATQDPDWCDDEYFFKIWRSLDKVRVGRDSLDRLFRRNGVKSHIKYAFDSKGPALTGIIHKTKQKRNDKKDILLDTTASRYIFGYINNRESQAKVSMRDRWNVEREWTGYDWWRMEIPETDKKLVGDLHEIDGYGIAKVGFANFLRDLHNEHPDVWFQSETKHPAYEKGEIITEEQPDGNVKRMVNMRYLSQAIRHARKPDPNPEQSQKDVRHILDFIKKLMGEELYQYELDTLAYMAQTGDRPGSLLFIVGDSGIGKSLWMNLLMAMFDGIGPEQSGIIDGSKLHNENARRFIFGQTEGCRILSIRELPEGSTSRDMAAITAQLKQIVDPGPEGDYITVEAKGINPRPTRNFARVLISSNYANAIHVEQHDRRIFYVQAQLTIETKPDAEYYNTLVSISQDPSRLAAFWRYLLSRDINNYSRYTSPPVSQAKAERIIAEIDSPYRRHAMAAMELLRLSDRTLFDTEEFAEILTELSLREHLNSGGESPKIEYDRNRNGKAMPEFMAAVKSIRTNEAVKLERKMRSAKVRPPQIYVMAKAFVNIPSLMELPKEKLLDAIEDEYYRGVVSDHPWKMYRKA